MSKTQPLVNPAPANVGLPGTLLPKGSVYMQSHWNSTTVPTPGYGGTASNDKKCLSCSRIHKRCGYCISHSLYRKKKETKVYENAVVAARDGLLKRIKKEIRKLEINDLVLLAESLESKNDGLTSESV